MTTPNPNSSEAIGYLVPVSTPPDEDIALAVDLQRLVVGLTGLPGQLVRPRWQPVPPKQPEANVDWCGIGVLSQASDDNISLRHDGTANGGLGSSTSFEYQTLEVMASFYGPGSGGHANALRAGLMIAQNREAMFLSDMALVGVPDKTARLPELVNDVWIDRIDLTFYVRRKVTRTWLIENLNGVTITTKSDQPPGNEITQTVTVAP